MLREAHIPILLWLPAAILLHALTGGGAVEVAKAVAERAAILEFSRGVRSQIAASLRGSGKPTEFDVVELEPEAQADEPLVTAQADPSDDAAKPPVHLPMRGALTGPDVPPVHEPEREAAKEKPPELTKPLPIPTPAQKPPEQPKLALRDPEKKPEQGQPKPLEPIARSEGRIAIQNDPTLDANQPDNPNAPRIADHAHHTDREEQARLRSYDQNAPRPTGGGTAHESNDREPGNADQEQRGHSVEAPGDGPPRPGADTGASPEREPEPVARNPLSAEQRIGQKALAADARVAAREAGHGPHTPEAVASDQGSYSLDPDAGGDGRPRQQARAGKAGRNGRRALDGMILPGWLPSRYSVNAYGLQQVLGEQNLRAEQEHARNVRLNKHRGVFKGINFNKYRAAIENYDPVVKEGNQTSLNAARVPFASYINKMHNRIHPIYADGFLASLSSHPDQRLGDMKLFTHIEIILDGRSGKLVTAGVVIASGVTALEVAALRALEEASPFGQPPDVILSPDGRVYLHWEFYRDPYYACTSRFARPYLLKDRMKGPEKPEPVPVPPAPRPSDGDSRKYGSRN